MLVYELEAAATTGVRAAHNPGSLSVDNTFVVVDAGGGTVDVTCHKVNPAA